MISCDYYEDRQGNPITVRGGCDARGAADAENLERQEAKIVTAIDTLDASVVSLMEIENSAVFGKDRGEALSALVESLNEAAGTQKWDFAPSLAPMQVFYEAGYTDVASLKTDEQTYVYQLRTGSHDHLGDGDLAERVVEVVTHTC